MANNHYEKWFLKTFSGLLFFAGGIIFMYYSLTHFETKDKWSLYGTISAATITLGVFLLSSAAIHKVKSDLIKKQKIRHQSG